jgi:hypothetical protein
MVFNATFNNISAIMWQSVLSVEEIGVSGENHKILINITDNILEQTEQHHFDINLTWSRHGITEELFTWR